jgi:hypothetical protein
MPCCVSFRVILKTEIQEFPLIWLGGQLHEIRFPTWELEASELSFIVAWMCVEQKLRATKAILKQWGIEASNCLINFVKLTTVKKTSHFCQHNMLCSVRLFLGHELWSHSSSTESPRATKIKPYVNEPSVYALITFECHFLRMTSHWKMLQIQPNL